MSNAALDLREPNAQPLAVAPRTASVTGPVAIPVTIENPTSVANVALTIPDNQRYISVAENGTATITWTLVDAGDAFFDIPAITFSGDDPGHSITQTLTSVTVVWPNTDEEAQKKSFYYRLHVVVPIDNQLIPVAHDPTVHNDPPTN